LFVDHGDFAGGSLGRNSHAEGLVSPVSDASLASITGALSQAGVEVYRVVGSEIEIAERVRLHIMDSGVRVRVDDQMRVIFRARSQRSDYPHMSADELLSLVRAAIGQRASAQGFVEDATTSREVRDPATQEHVLDVWHEVTYAKDSASVSSLIGDVQWALQLEKYVSE